MKSAAESAWWMLVVLWVMVGPLPGARGQQMGEPNRAMIKPSLVRLQPGQTQQFKAIMLATYLMAADAPKQVTWSVNGIEGGNEQVGTIDANGVYEAPAAAPSPNEIHIIAHVPEAANSLLFATVLVGDDEPKYELVNTWSEPIKSAEHFKSPHGIGLDKDGNLLIADVKANRVLRFTPDGKFLGDVGDGSGGEPGKFVEPRLAIIDDKGNIWATDSKSDRPRLQVFSPDGKFERQFAEKGILPGFLLRAHGMGFDRQQRLFVVDVDNFRVNVYSHDGDFLYDWGQVGTGPGQFNAPHGLYVDPSGDVFISGYYGPIQKFDSQGNYLFRFCHGDPPDGPVYFHSISGDRWGNVFVMVRNRSGYDNQLQTDGGRRLSVMKFNNNGDFVTGWSLEKPEHRESWAVVADDGTVYSLFQDAEHVGVQTFVPR
ncbi:MAG: NHL repeat-containing protein [Phycisphaeraceae bacterium]|nr:NHL repeat-containing protein [Phycisphaeraceae bacterium]